MVIIKKLSLFTIVIFSCFALSFAYAVQIQNDLSCNLLRMHIIPNSNSSVDRSIKQTVRNDVLNLINEESTLHDITSAANRSLRLLGADYSASASVERCYVPQKSYKNLQLPEGEYTCIKITLGNGGGANWWCVAYPPLCFTEEAIGELSESGMKALENNLSHEALQTIIKSGDVNFRFKLVEEIQKLRFKYQ